MKLTGKIMSCVEASAICGYRCCDQDIPIEGEEVKPTDYILMYPGEYDPADERQNHLTPVGMHNGGVLARCIKECFDQSACHPDVNYKPLDCMSYPLMPKVTGGELALAKDSRCPLILTDISDGHREAILKRWQEVAVKNNKFLEWLINLSLEGYE